MALPYPFRLYFHRRNVQRQGSPAGNFNFCFKDCHGPWSALSSIYRKGVSMNDTVDPTATFYKFLSSFPVNMWNTYNQMISASLEKSRATQLYWNGILKYFHDFIESYAIAVGYFQSTEREKIPDTSPWQNLIDYMKLMQLNLQIASGALTGSSEIMSEYHMKELTASFSAFMDTIMGIDDRALASKAANQADLMERVVHTYPRAIGDIRSEFGFHFDNGHYEKTAETDRFYLYQVLPLDKTIKVKKKGKPILVVPPYVLGANVLAFLPGENKSYVHNFAHQGIPTYIRINKDIGATPAFQTMTGEDDAVDTRYFCEILKKKHGRTVTLNGYCQGGYNALCNILSGELDGLVDALITCVSPMDGTRSKGLGTFLKSMLPQRFNDLRYGTKRLPNGNIVADGKLMGWVYKLKAIEDEFPLVSFYRDMIMLSAKNGKEATINKTVAAIQHWLRFERVDLPMGITEISFKSYNTPITDDGTLPITLFGRKLNLHRIEEKGLPWLICYGETDDLVEKETALAPLDYIHAEVSPFPKGHLAIATSWSNPQSEYALHSIFGEKRHRGPVRFQMDLDEPQTKGEKKNG